jgi:hypothetical protein
MHVDAAIARINSLDSKIAAAAVHELRRASRPGEVVLVIDPEHRPMQIPDTYLLSNLVIVDGNLDVVGIVEEHRRETIH